MVKREHITNVIEIKEMGILLRVGRCHSVRVCGATVAVQFPSTGAAKEFLKPRADDTAYSQYFSGELDRFRQDPQEVEYGPRVPPLFIQRDGKLVYLHRDWR